MPRRVTDVTAATEPTPPRNGPSNEEFAEFLACDIEIGSQIARLNAARGTNMARYENMGGDPDEIRDGRKIDRDGLAVLRRMSRVAGMMGLIKVDADGQANFIEVLDPDKQAAEQAALGPMVLRMARADMDGWNSGFAGGTAVDCPFNGTDPVESELYQQWTRACQDGRDARAEKMLAKGKIVSEAVDTSRERPAPEADAAVEAAPTDEPSTDTAEVTQFPRRTRRQAAQ